ncbi:MAG: DNA-binding response regulator [Bacteroidetes bacterium]|nr:MAG: DNA-binding response regulator [Bacteroidota bacterium]
MKLRCLIVDDEPLARQGLAGYVEKVDFLELVTQTGDPTEALGLLARHPVDLLLLDIHMPHLSGIDLLKSLPDPPLVILTTAYPSYALEGYQLDVLDYLVKPITFPRFLKAVNKARQQHQLRQQAQPSPPDQAEHFFIKVEHQYEKIRLDEIRYVEGMQNYVAIHTDRGRFLTLLTMKAVEAELPGPRFLRVHKSYLVATARVDTVQRHELRIGDQAIPIGRSYRDQVIDDIVLRRLMGR